MDAQVEEFFPANEAKFDELFATEEACYAYLFKLRWPDGFRCPRCGEKQSWLSARGLLICSNCEYNQSLTAGTIFHSTKKPLKLWFKAMWCITTRKNGVSAATLHGLGLGSYKTCWRMLQKLRSCMSIKGHAKLIGAVEADEFYIGGQATGGKRGRGAEHKVAVAIAVEKDGKKWGRVRLQVIEACSAGHLIPFIRDNVELGSTVFTDGWSSYKQLGAEGYNHMPDVQPKDQKGAKGAGKTLDAAHGVISLVKRLMLGTFQGRFDKRYLQRYLDAYTFRFNRRKTKVVGKRFFRLVQQVACSAKLVNTTLAPIPLGLAN
jgi:transposase-like protein